MLSCVKDRKSTVSREERAASLNVSLRSSPDDCIGYIPQVLGLTDGTWIELFL